jgi:hypothetical protein
VEDLVGVDDRAVRDDARERRQDAPETTLDFVSTRGDSGLSLRARAARMSALSCARWTGGEKTSQYESTRTEMGKETHCDRYCSIRSSARVLRRRRWRTYIN